MPKQQPWLISMEYNAVFARGDDGGTSRIKDQTIVLIDESQWKYIAQHKLNAAADYRPPYKKHGERLSDEILAVHWAVQIPVGGLTEEEIDALS
jgi:hypothetical protein